jgi:hypothetical protein
MLGGYVSSMKNINKSNIVSLNNTYIILDLTVF